ncbi:hypothetical protein CERZMDRAFT_102109 [Cercospora zeae-maydis SCOH1-5]|uniref:Uncharacterized protein n=1 Tax=Cercospora zeae-maydis SCOH1-5 TaxID=717836 RepID=A0A6A6F225_9PEZI|nr:hypothetical protein CERZMDRAFT_102109 [Cercospora zeae-maydis SCOH1-5]
MGDGFYLTELSPAALAKSVQELKVDSNTYGRLTVGKILSGKDDAGQHEVPEEHIYDGIMEIPLPSPFTGAPVNAQPMNMNGSLVEKWLFEDRLTMATLRTRQKCSTGRGHSIATGSSKRTANRKLQYIEASGVAEEFSATQMLAMPGIPNTADMVIRQSMRDEEWSGQMRSSSECLPTWPGNKRFSLANHHIQAGEEDDGVSDATSQPASTSTSSPSLPDVTVLPRNIHELKEEFNGYGHLSAEDILYKKNASGECIVPEEHVYGGVFLKVKAVYKISEIAEAINDKKEAVGKRKTTPNSYTKRHTGALVAKAAADAACKGGEVNIYKALVDADVAAGRPREVAEACRKQKWTGSRNGTYGTGSRAATESSATSQSKRKRSTLDEQAVGQSSKRQALSRDDAQDQASVISQAFSHGSFDDQSGHRAEGSEHTMSAQFNTTTALNEAGLYAITTPSLVPQVPIMTDGHGYLPLLPMNAGIAFANDQPFSSDFPEVTIQDSEQAMADLVAFLDANPLHYTLAGFDFLLLFRISSTAASRLAPLLNLCNKPDDEKVICDAKLNIFFQVADGVQSDYEMEDMGRPAKRVAGSPSYAAGQSDVRSCAGYASIPNLAPVKHANMISLFPKLYIFPSTFRTPYEFEFRSASFSFVPESFDQGVHSQGPVHFWPVDQGNTVPRQAAQGHEGRDYAAQNSV